MKTIASRLALLLAIVLSAGAADAGIIFLRNDLGYSTPVVVKHNKKTVYQGWLRHGEAARLEIDVNRPKKPILTFLAYRYGGSNSYGSTSSTQPMSWPLPKKDKTLFFNLSLFASRYQTR